MPFEPQKAHWHVTQGYVSPHLPYEQPPVEEASAPEEVAVEEAGDAHEFSETVEVTHEDPVVEEAAVEVEPEEDEPEAAPEAE